MAVGRISGPLLKSNLLRNGENLAFETDLLYLNVTDPSSANYKVGIKTSNPAYTLDINGTTRTTNLLVPTAATIGSEIYISSSGISSLAGDLVLQAATSGDKVKLNSNLYVDGTITATGDIIANGNITLGNQTTDTVTFGAEVASNIIPTTTDTYNLGSALLRWNAIYVKTANIAVLNTSGVLTVTDTTQSTSTSTGSIVTSGGVGIAKNVYIGGTLNVTGTTTLAGVSATSVTDSGLTATRVIFAGTGGLLTDSVDLSFTSGTSTLSTVNISATSVTSTNFTDTSLTSGRITFAGTGGLLSDSSTLTYNTGTTTLTVPTISVATALSAPSITDSGLTSGRVTYAGTGGLLKDSGNLTFDGTTLTVSSVTVTGNEVVQGTLSVTGDFSVNTNKFTVQASSGNTLVAGTLNVTGGSQFAAVNATNGRFTGTFQVDGASTLGSLSAGGTTLSSLAVTTTASVGTSLSVGTTLGVTGATTLTTLSTSGAATLNSLSVTNNALVSGSLTAGATTVSSATVSNLTSTRLVLAGSAGALTDSNKLTFDGTILTVTANATISGNLNVDGNITLGGNITIGDNVVDTVTVTADFTSDLIPKTTNSYDLGTSLLRWRKLYSNTLDVSGATTLTGDITAGGKLNVTGLTTLSTLTTTGLATLNNASITNDASVGGNLTVTGTTSVTGNIIGNLVPNTTTQNIGSLTNYWQNAYFSGSLNFANFLASGNTISVTNTNGSITLQPNGTGNVIISSTKSLQIPVGNISARPGTPANGMIRYNSELTQYEGYSAGNWSSLGGVRSVDGNAYIIAETSPGAGDDILHFYAGASASSNVGNWSDTALTILSPGFRVPTGTTLGRPTGVDGYIRFNTSINKFEGFANSVWSSLGGVSSTSGTTYIGAEAYPGAGDNTLYFYANGVQQATIDPTATTIHNLLNVDNTTNSVSTITGAIVTAGGIGIAKNLYVGANANIAGTLTVSSDVTLSPANHNVAISPTGTGSVTISSGALGSIDNMSIGATTASTGRFTTLTATTSANFSPSGTVTINPTTASTMDNVSIGSTTRAPGAFTTLASNGLTTFTDTTQSTSSSSGAVVVTGGVGVGKNLYVGGNINSTGTITAGSTLTASAAVNLNPSNFNVSISPTGTGTVTINPASVGAVDNVNIGATTRGTGAFTTLTSNSATTFTAGTASTNTTSGTIVVTGGVGISGNLNVGGSFNAGAGTFTSVTDSGLTAGRVTFAGTGGLLSDSNALTYSAGTLTVGTGLDVNGVTITSGNVTLTGGNVSGATNITGTGTVQGLNVNVTSLTSGRVTYASTSGQLVDSANLTFNGTTLTANAFSTTNNLTVGGTLQVTLGTTLDSTLSVAGVTTISNSTDSTTTTNGALKVAGGVGIVKNLNVGGNSRITGTETVDGTFTANAAVSLSPSNYNVTISPTGTGYVTINPTTLGAMDNVAVGANTRASGAFTTLASNGNATFSGSGSVVSLTPSGAGYVTINPAGVGSIDNMVIGANTAKAGTFTALTATTSASLSPTGSVTINPGTLSSVDNVNIGANTRGTGAFTTLTSNGATTFTSGTDSSSSTNGAVVVSGGVGIAKNLNVGINLTVTGVTTANGTLTANAAVNLNPNNYAVSIQPTGTGTATINPAAVGAIDNMIIGANTPKAATFTALTTQGNVTLNGSGSVVSLTPTGSGYVTINPGALGTINNMSIGATTASTGKFTTLQATTSANLNTSGDVSIQPSGTVTINPTTVGAIDNVNIGATTRGTAKVSTLDANDTVTFTSSTQSTSTTSGAVQIAGGVGIVKNLFVGGDTNIAGNLTVLGTTTTIQSTVTTLTDPVIAVGGLTDTGLVDAANRGVQTRYATDISSLVTNWVGDTSSSVVANLSVTSASLGIKLGDKINISGSGVTNLDGIGIVTTVDTNSVTFTAPGAVATGTSANIATVGLSKNGFFGYEPTSKKFVYIPDATISSNVVTGNYGDAEFNSLTLISALAVTQGGSGATNFTTKGIVFGNGTDPLQVTAASDMGGANATASYGILTTDSSNTPVWTDVIDCGTY